MNEIKDLKSKKNLFKKKSSKIFFVSFVASFKNFIVCLHLIVIVVHHLMDGYGILCYEEDMRSFFFSFSSEEEKVLLRRIKYLKANTDVEVRITFVTCITLPLTLLPTTTTYYIKVHINFSCNNVYRFFFFFIS